MTEVQQRIRRDLNQLRREWDHAQHEATINVAREFGRRRLALAERCASFGHVAGEPDGEWPYATRCEFCGTRMDDA